MRANFLQKKGKKRKSGKGRAKQRALLISINEKEGHFVEQEALRKEREVKAAEEKERQKALIEDTTPRRSARRNRSRTWRAGSTTSRYWYY